MSNCQCRCCNTAMNQGALSQGTAYGLQQQSPQMFGDGVGFTPHPAPIGGKTTLMKSEVYTGVFQSFPLTLEELARITMEGSRAQGHYLHGWKEVPDGFKVYSEAHGRHVLREAQAQGPDEVLHEVLTVAWNALARAEHLIKSMRKAEVAY